MATTLSGTGITFTDSTAQTTAGIGSTYVPPVDIQTFVGPQTGGGTGTGTWTKPTAGQTMAQIELWGGGAGGQGSTGGCAGGYTMFYVPLVQLPSTLTCNAPSNQSSYNNGTGQAASITAFTAQSGWMAVTQNYLSASAGSAGSAGTGYILTAASGGGGPMSNAGGGKSGNSGGYPWGGTGTGASGNSPGGGSGTNGGNGGTFGGGTQVRITCW